MTNYETPATGEDTSRSSSCVPTGSGLRSVLRDAAARVAREASVPGTPRGDLQSGHVQVGRPGGRAVAQEVDAELDDADRVLDVSRLRLVLVEDLLDQVPHRRVFTVDRHQVFDGLGGGLLQAVVLVLLDDDVRGVRAGCVERTERAEETERTERVRAAECGHV